MKTSLLRAGCVLGLAFLSATLAPARAADTNPPPRLTVELRDGSRVVGTSAEKNFKFHSALLGELKLEAKDIRSIDCVATNSAKLTTAGGDVLTVWFVNPELRVNTGFGKVELTVNSIRRASVSVEENSGRTRGGLVALWSGEGDAHDRVGSNHGVLEGEISFTTGKVGQAFSFNDNHAGVKIPAASSLDVGTADGLTLAAWINPSDVSGVHPLFEWNAGNDTAEWGAHFYIGASLPGALYACLTDSSNSPHQIHSAADTVVTDRFQHVALTYDKSSGVGKLYLNGRVVAQEFWGQFTPQTSYDFYLGRRPLTHGETYTFAGLLDEAAIYNRALSAEEIRADYEAGNKN